MVTLADLDPIAETSRKLFYGVFERRSINPDGIAKVADDFIPNALRLYLSMPIAERYKADFVSAQYEIFGHRVCNNAQIRGDTQADFNDFYTSIWMCGIVFVCTPPTP